MEKTIYSGKIFDLVQRTVTLPNGKDTLRDILLMNGAAVILPVLEGGGILFVRQYREGAGAEMLELPAGMIGRGEDPLTCAERELREETGYTARTMRFLLKFYSGPGYTTEMMHVYLAEGLTPGAQQLDEDEFIKTEEYSLNEALDMIRDGRISDAKTVSSLLYYARFYL